MNSYSWVKMKLRMLDSPDIVLLNDALKWRFVSCILLAGRVRDDGYLLDDRASAVALRIPVEQFKSEMSVLAQNGLVELRRHPDGDERWFVSNFTKHQEATGTAQRKRQQRRRETANSDSPDDKSVWDSYLSVYLSDSSLSEERSIDRQIDRDASRHCHDIVTCRDIIHAFQRHGIGRNRRTEALLQLPHMEAAYVDWCVKHADNNIGLAIWYMEHNEPMPVSKSAIPPHLADIIRH